MIAGEESGFTLAVGTSPNFMMTKLLSRLALSAILALVCVSAHALTVVRSMAEANLGEGHYFAFFERQEVGWKLIDISTSRPFVSNVDRQEVLVFTNTLSRVQPDFHGLARGEVKDGHIICEKGLLAKHKGYHPCSSSLTSVSVGRTVAGATLGALISVVTATVLYDVTVDREKVLALIQETGTLERLREKIASVELEQFLVSYRNSFSSAKTAAQFDGFASYFANKDPENLVPQAIERRDELRIKEAEELKRREVAEAMRRAERDRELEEQRQLEIEQRRQRTVQVDAFRRALKIETVTNCGPVLEIKGALLKIYFPVANYGTEHWLKKDELFPPKYGCRFVNGSYQPPPV